MTKVSWKRILQNAGEGLPADEQMRLASQGDMPETRDPRNTRRPHSYPHAQPQRGLSGFEMDLQHALKRAAHIPEPRPAHVRRREPVRAQAPEPVEHRRAQLPVPYVRPQPVPIRPHSDARRKGGMRNLIAISLSAAIVGFAAHEVSVQWQKSRAGIARQGKVATSDPGVTGAVRGKQAALMQTSYAIQPLASGGKDADSTTGDQPVEVLSNTRMEAYAGSSEIRNDADAAPKVVAIKPAEEQLLMGRAMAHIEQGDISAARLFLQHLASRNSALGAISLAKTYDARYIAAFNIRGLRAEPEMARKWYKRAAELGSSEAATYLSSAR